MSRRAGRAEQTVREWISCRADNPEDPEMECLNRKGHCPGGLPHAVEVWPEGFQQGPSFLVEWNDERVLTDERRGTKYDPLGPVSTPEAP